MRTFQLTIVSLLTLHFAAPLTARAGVVDPCLSTAVASGDAVFCPAGDGTGQTITVTIRDGTGAPVAGVPAADIEAVFCETPQCPCSEAQPLIADAATDALGQTTISGVFATGGAFSGVRVIAQGIEIADPDDCSTPFCILSVRTPDVNCDLDVNLTDLAFLATLIETGSFDDRCDFNGDGVVNAIDLALFAPHYYHACTS